MTATLPDVERVVRVMAETVVANEKYFGDLDAVVGDGDFGYSMARGFEIVLSDWDAFDRTDISTFLQEGRRRHHQPDRRHVRSHLGYRVPARGHDRGRRGEPGRPTRWSRCCAPPSRESRPAAAPSSARRPCSTRWCPPPTPSRHRRRRVRQQADTLRAAAVTARSAAEATRPMLAKRGRAAYTGERSIGTLDAGAVAVAVLLEALADQWT